MYKLLQLQVLATNLVELNQVLSSPLKQKLLGFLILKNQYEKNVSILTVHVFVRRSFATDELKLAEISAGNTSVAPTALYLLTIVKQFS